MVVLTCKKKKKQKLEKKVQTINISSAYLPKENILIPNRNDITNNQSLMTKLYINPDTSDKGAAFTSKIKNKFICKITIH